MVMVGIEDIKEVGPGQPILKVVGVGGGGGNAVNRMISTNIRHIDFVVANTDLQDLKSNLAPYKIQLGGRCTRGLGAGAKPEVGREAALEDMEAIREHLVGADMVFITAGLGGGTGTGAAPVIAEVARELGCLTVGVVTKPFKFEGRVRQRNGEEGILALRKHVDTLIVIPNDNLLTLANKKTSIVEAFTMADDVLRIAIQGISDLISKEAYINLDFADVRTVMSNMGQAIMGTGIGTGDNRAIEAAEKAIRSPLLDDCRIDGAKGLLLNISGSSSLTLHEVNEAASFITDHADEDAVIIFGARIDEAIPQDQIEVTVIATGFGPRPHREAPGEAAPAMELKRPRPSYKVFSSATPTATPPLRPTADEDEDSIALSSALRAPEPAPQPVIPPPIAAKPMVAERNRDDDVFELENPIMEPVESAPQIPSSYRPDQKASVGRNDPEADLDIPTFIRKRSKRFSDE
ncbi:MAG TPA: cell division protein FtsZ [bacterium]